MIFKDPWVLGLIPLILIAVAWQWRRKRPQTLRFPSGRLVSSLKPTWKNRFNGFPYFLRAVVLVLLCMALAGPRSVLEETQSTTEGIDIVLALDASGSMAAEDFKVRGQRVNRLDVVKGVVKEFIEGRQGDRIGLVAFAALAYTVSPLTTDYSWLKTNLERIRLHLIQDGTAIGSAISSSLARLGKSRAKSKVIILLTDGMNNAGKVSPRDAARAAAALGVRIYTIGAGTKGAVPFPVTDVFGRKRYQNALIDIDETTLRDIADLTGGQFFRATDTASLKAIYSQIDAMEKTEIEQFDYKEYKELFGLFCLVALATLVLEIVLSHTLFLRIP